MRPFPAWYSWILPVLALGLFTVVADAADSTQVKVPARLEICFDLESYSNVLAVDPGEPFRFYVVAHGTEGGIRAWEAKILIDERIRVLDRAADGIDLAPEKDVWRVGLGKDCGVGENVLLATYTARLENEGEEDLVLGTAPVEHGTFNPPAPGYLSCLSFEDKRPFVYADTTAVVNPVHLQMEAFDQNGSSPLFRMQHGSHDR